MTAGLSSDWTEMKTIAERVTINAPNDDEKKADRRT